MNVVCDMPLLLPLLADPLLSMEIGKNSAFRIDQCR